jgi:hypothetical protein
MPDGTRMLKAIAPVSGVPFLRETRHNKVFRIKEKSENRIILEV